MNYLFICLAALITTNAGYKHIGCYVDTLDRALRFGPHQYGYTIESCAATCADYRYFALQNNGWCCCESDFNHATKYGAGDGCPASQLGTGYRNDLFEHDGQKSSYVGCYGDIPDRRLPEGPHAYGYNQQSCSDSCLTYKFFALEHNGWCSCGNDWSRASSEGTRDTCPSSRLGAAMANDIFMHDALVGCDIEGCDDNNQCTTEQCIEGSCVRTPADCTPADGGDPCTVYSCDPDSGCKEEPFDCDDGDICNGEEACINGQCMSADDFECPANFICDSEQRRCVPNCKTFAFDGYMKDCSVEWHDNLNNMEALNDGMDEALGRLDALDLNPNGRCAMIEADVASLTTKQLEIDNRLKEVEENLAAPITRAPTTSPTFSVCNTDLGLDIGFLIDESSSIDDTEFDSMISFMARLIEYDINDISSVSLFQYAKESHFKQILPFTGVAGNGRQQIINAVKQNVNNGEGTYTGYAIRETLKLFPINNERPDLLFVLTDGRPSDPICPLDVGIGNIEIVLIGIGTGSGIDMNALKSDQFNCLYDDVNSDVFHVPKFSKQDFIEKEAALRQKTCRRRKSESSIVNNFIGIDPKQSQEPNQFDFNMMNLWTILFVTLIFNGFAYLLTYIFCIKSKVDNRYKYDAVKHKEEIQIINGE